MTDHLTPKEKGGASAPPRSARVPSALEDQLRPELQAAPSDAVGDDVSGKGIATIIVEGKAAELVDAIYAVDGAVDVHDRYAEPLMVEQVERLSLELNGKALRHLRVLEHSHVDRADGLTSLRIAADSERRAEN